LRIWKKTVVNDPSTQAMAFKSLAFAQSFDYTQAKS